MRLRCGAVVVAGWLLLLRPSASHAQSARDAALRLELLRQAQEARAGNDHARALDLATRAGSISMTPSVRMFIAQEENAAGQLAEAYANAGLCAREAERDSALRNRDTILNACHALAEALRPMLGHVIVHVPEPPPPELHVSLAGSELNAAFYGVSTFVTPGPLTIDATAAGQPPFHTRVTISPGAAVDVTVHFGETESHAEPVRTASASPAPASTNGSTSTAIPSAAPPRETRTAVSPTRASPTRTAAPQPSSGSVAPAIALFAGGAISLAAAAAFVVLRSGALNRLAMYCTVESDGLQHCDNSPDAHDANNAAQTYTYAADATLAIGIAAVVAGAVALVVVRLGSHAVQPEHAELRVAPVPGGAWLGVGGSF